MLSYIQKYYIDLAYGPSYAITNAFYIVCIVLLLRPKAQERNRKYILGLVGEILVMEVVSICLNGILHDLFGDEMALERITLILMMGLYGGLISKLKPVTRIVRCFVFFSGLLNVIPISEPLGVWLKQVNSSYLWGEHCTWMAVVILGLGMVWVLLRYSTEELTFVPFFPCALLGVISMTGVLWQLVSPVFHLGRGYNLLMAMVFLGITMLGYAMFYAVSSEYDQNLELLAMQHKQMLDEELLLFSRENYREIHELRHELKNHMGYIKLMADSGEYGKLKAYVAEVCGEAEEIFRFVDCGNQVINAVLNHSIRRGEEIGVKIEHQVVLPPQIPFKETEFCSLLSNLLDNALEAATESGVEEPVVVVRIRPQLDYLFIHVENPVNDSLSLQRRLSLQTTKTDKKLHGYGTRLIRNLAEKYQGSVKFNMKDGVFTADVMLCLVQEESHGED